MPVMYSIKDILSDEHLFGERFMSKATSEKLNGIPPEHLRRALLRLQDFGTYYGYSTQRSWTPQNHPEPTVTIGCLSANGDMDKPRFGFCCGDVCGEGAGAGFLHLWTDEETVTTFLQTYSDMAFEDHWVPWRRLKEQDQFVLHKTPVMDPKGKFHLFNEKTDPAVKAFLKYLSRRISPTENAIAAIQPLLNKHGHEPDAITPLILDEFRHPDDY